VRGERERGREGERERGRKGREGEREKRERGREGEKGEGEKGDKETRRGATRRDAKLCNKYNSASESIVVYLLPGNSHFIMISTFGRDFFF
jgi:hypothetical protein